jgi:putative ABC transport system permease protein
MRRKHQSTASHSLLPIARLRDGFTADQADAQLQSLRAYWSAKHPDHYAKGHFAVSRSLHEDLAGDQRDALFILSGAVLFVLLIVCVNLAALLVSKGEARRREFVVLANALLAALLALYPVRLPVWQAITIDHIALLYACALVIFAGFLVGLVPALNATGTRMQEALRAESRASTASRRAVAARSVLVISQLAFSVILLVGALLLIRSYQQLQRVNLGIEPDHVLTFSLSVPPARQQDAAAARRTLASIEARLAATPGVDLAGAISNLPLASAGPPDDFNIDGRPEPPPGAPAWNARYLMVTPRVFRALGIPLKRGRLLGEGDVAGRPLVAIINETAARLYWPGVDPVGGTIRYNPRETSPAIRIVGIVGDVRSMGASAPAPPAVYVPFEQAPRPPYQGRTMAFIVRTTGNLAGIVPSARAAVASIDAGLPLANVRPMSEIVSASAGEPRFTTLVMSFFAGVAFFLAALGLYGILAYGVEQRIREIGVRIALGADNGEIFRLIIGNGMGPRGRGRSDRRSDRIGVDETDGGTPVRYHEHRSGDVSRGGRDAGRLRAAGELQAGPARHARRPHRRAPRRVSIVSAVAAGPSSSGRSHLRARQRLARSIMSTTDAAIEKSSSQFPMIGC